MGKSACSDKIMRLLGAILALMVSPCALSAYTMLAKDPPARKVWLEELNLSKMSQGWGKPMAGKSVKGTPLLLGGKKYEHGVGTHARSEMMIKIHGATAKFAAKVGIDDTSPKEGSAIFQVWIDDRKIVDSGVMRTGDPPKQINAEVAGAQVMYLVVTDAGDSINADNADWADAQFEMYPGVDFAPEAVLPDPGPAMSIAPADKLQLGIHGPLMISVEPNKPFSYQIPATGKASIAFSAANLPDGLSLDPKAGIISGLLKTAVKTDISLTAKDAGTTAVRRLAIVCEAEQPALAPPVKWNLLQVSDKDNGGAGGLTSLAPNERASQISISSLLSSPLLISGNFSQMDDLGRNIVCNDDVIDISKDALSGPAKRIAQIDDIEIWTRLLSDGATAVGIFNLGFGPADIGFDWTDLGLSGPQQVRDLWMRKDLGTFEKSYANVVPRHGVVLLKVRKI